MTITIIIIIVIIIFIIIIVVAVVNIIIAVLNHYENEPEIPAFGCDALQSGTFEWGCIHTSVGRRPMDRWNAAPINSSSDKSPNQTQKGTKNNIN